MKVERPVGGGNSMMGEENYDYMIDDNTNRTPSPTKKPKRRSSVGSGSSKDTPFDDEDV